LFYSTGDGLIAEYYDTSVSDLSDSHEELSQQILDGLTDELELVEFATCRVDPLKQQAIVEIDGEIVRFTDQFDDPVTSFIGSAFAIGLGKPVSVKSHENASESMTITCRWEDTAWMNGKFDQHETKLADLLSKED
jgi:hypothetical protein